MKCFNFQGSLGKSNICTFFQNIASFSARIQVESGLGFQWKKVSRSCFTLENRSQKFIDSNF